MNQNTRKVISIIIAIVSSLVFLGLLYFMYKPQIDSLVSNILSRTPEEIQTEYATPVFNFQDFYIPTAPGINLIQNEYITIDYSNTGNGYIKIKHTIPNNRVRVKIISPNGANYVYTLRENEFEVLPLTEGSGEYQIGVFKHNGEDGIVYNPVFFHNINVVMKNEFIPFTIPNQFVSFTPECQLVILAARLTATLETTYEKVYAIYNHIIHNINYDNSLAYRIRTNNIFEPIIPNPNKTLSLRAGICLDYASLFAAMLRSQGIPTKLVFGYFDEDLYHAWNMVYIDNEWYLIDPTFSSERRSRHRSGIIRTNHNLVLYDSRLYY